MPALSIRSLRKSFLVGPAHSPRRAEALNGVDLEVAEGEVLGIVGGESAGKTTLLLCAAGILRRDSGVIYWHGERFSGGGCLPGLAYVPAVPTYYPFLSVRDVLDCYCAKEGFSARRRRRSVDTECARLNLSERLSVPVSRLGVETLKRVGIAQAMVQGATVILLDATLDGLGGWSSVVYRAVADAALRGITIIAATRDPGAVAPVAARMLVMDAGRITGSFVAEQSNPAAPDSVFAPLPGGMRQIAERVH